MKTWFLAAFLSVPGIVSPCVAGGDAGRVSGPVPGGGHCGRGLSCQRLVGAAATGRLMKVSEKSRSIARRLDRSGYYSYLSRAYKGYPHLRSKKRNHATASWTGVSAENRRRYQPHAEKIARAHGLDPNLMDAVIVVESAYDPNAVSSRGAMGLMQLMPGTAKRFDVSDPFDPIENMRGGARYLRWLLDRYGNDLPLVLAAFNAGEGAVDQYGKQVPPYDETRGYVARILNLLGTTD